MTSESTPTDKASSEPGRGASGDRSRRRSAFSLRRLAIKELRETLRDRRTIITLILMPLIVYPILSLVFKTFLLSNAGVLTSGAPVVFQIAYEGNADREQVTGVLNEVLARLEWIDREESRLESLEEKEPATDSDKLGIPASNREPAFAKLTAHKWIFVSATKEFTLEELVESQAADIGFRFDLEKREPWELGGVSILSRNDQISQLATDYFLDRFEALNDIDRNMRLKRFNLPTGPALSVASATVAKEGADGSLESSKAFPLASLVPLILVLMTITGAVYPAIDLTAGERERGTLETLMAAPVPQVGILCSKYIAVLTVAVLTAMLNLIGMFATVWAFQLDQQFGGGVFNFTVMVKIFLLLILFAAFFSALLLAVTSFAKSFKEAQVYLIPVILLSLGPGLIAMTPGMSLGGLNAVTPMINILLLARDVIQDQVMVVPAIIAIVSTLLYSYLAIRLAARIFGSDSILYAGGGSVTEMFHRPLKKNYIVPMTATVFCLVMLFPINFASIGFLGRMSSETVADLELRYLTMAVFTFLAFLVLPWVVAKHQNTSIASGFGLRSPKLVFVLAGVLLGVSMWPIVMSLTSGWHELYGFLFGSEQQDLWHDRLVEMTSAQVDRIRKVSPLVIAVAFSIVPAVCEEWFFRGMLLRSLLRSRSVWKAILISAVVFGSFHMLSNSVIAIDRLIPTTLIGVMLGYLAYKSDSILPGIILHSFNNAIVIFLAYYQPKLSALSWFPGEEDSIPVMWVVAGLVVASVGAAIVWSTRRQEQRIPNDLQLGSNAVAEAI